MSNFFSYSFRNISLIIVIGMVCLIAGPLIIWTVISEGTPLSYFNYQQALAQQPFTPNNNNTNTSENYPGTHVIAQASGHFANNQIKDGIVTWIQGGLWNLQIKSLPYNNTSNYTGGNNTEKPKITAIFNANFTMIKPDGSFSHNHIINNFSSNYVFITKNDIVVIGIADIHSNIGLEFKQVPITVHLMGKKVLGVTINVNKSNGHFASSNEMFGTLISGIGLTKSDTNNTAITNASNNRISIPLNNSAIK
jgi:hypothetical protein